jgi:hypothetical protein
VGLSCTGKREQEPRKINMKKIAWMQAGKQEGHKSLMGSQLESGKYIG